MSDQFDTIDEVFRSKLGDHSVSPPDAVWDRIETQRSFGHVIANKISVNWRTFGTMLLILLGGGMGSILFGNDEAEQPLTEIPASIKKTKEPNRVNHKTINNLGKQDKDQTVLTFLNPSVEKEDQAQINLPDLELVASVHQAGFTKPIIHANPQLHALIEAQNGWESAKPVSFSREYHMQQLEQKSVLLGSKKMERKMNRTHLEYDYVLDGIKKKRFRDRSSLLFSFTPQGVTKRMVAEYNLSSSYLDHRANSEKTRLAYTLSANLHYEMNNHKFIETGINFTQLYEEMHFKGEKVFSNQYNFLEIPFLIGYEERNSKWGFQVKSGFGLQIMNTYDGFIYKKYEEVGNNTSTIEPLYRAKKGSAVRNVITSNHNLSRNQDPNEVLDLSEEEDNPFKRGGVVNFHMSAGITYYHSINTSFVIAPYYRRNINSITKESALFSERITLVGISFGTRVKF